MAKKRTQSRVTRRQERKPVVSGSGFMKPPGAKDGGDEPLLPLREGMSFHYYLLPMAQDVPKAYVDYPDISSAFEYMQPAVREAVMEYYRRKERELERFARLVKRLGGIHVKYDPVSGTLKK